MPEINTTDTSSEISLWKGHPSQWLHSGYYALCLLIAAGALVGIPFTAGLSAIGMILPVVMWGVRWWITKATAFELTTQRLRITKGILNRRLDELELYRVKDYAIEQPLLLRLVGLSNITLVTSDSTTPTVPIWGISGGNELREKIRAAVQSERDRKRVRELDVDGENPMV